MKAFLLLFLNFIVVTAAPYTSASVKPKLQHLVLAEIIQSIKELNNSLTAEIFVQKAITTEDCTHKNFCKAGNVLSAYKAEELGLKEKDWLLPRKLVAYTRDIHCKDPVSEDRINLRQLLNNIHWCAQKEYSKPIDTSTRFPFSHRN